MLWEKTKVVYSGNEVIGDSSRNFSLSIPPSAAALAKSSQTLKDYKVVWRFDVGLDHDPIPFVGTRISKAFYLDLHDSRIPHLAPPSPPDDITIGDVIISMTPPHGAFGPGDTIPCSYHAESSTEPIRKITVVLERVIQLTGRDPITTTIASTSMSKPPPRRSLRLALPPRGGRWDSGETLSTQWTTITFQLRLRVLMAGRKPLQTPPIPVLVTSVPAAERAEPPPTPRVRRSARRGLYMHEGTIDIADPAVGLIPASPILLPPRPPLKPILVTSGAGSSNSILRVDEQSAELSVKPLRLQVPEEESLSILRRYQQNGRRISTTASEEEDLQPLRSRQKMRESVSPTPKTPPTPPASPPAPPPASDPALPPASVV